MVEDLWGVQASRDVRTEIHPDRAMCQLLSDAVVEADPGAGGGGAKKKKEKKKKEMSVIK